MSHYIILESDTEHGVAYAKGKINPLTMETKPFGKKNKFKQHGPLISNKDDAEKIVWHCKEKARLQGRTVLPVTF